MSRIAKYPVDIPAKVEVTLAGGRVDVKGPLGTLSRDFGGSVKIVFASGSQTTSNPSLTSLADSAVLI